MTTDFSNFLLKEYNIQLNSINEAIFSNTPLTHIKGNSDSNFKYGMFYSEKVDVLIENFKTDQMKLLLHRNYYSKIGTTYCLSSGILVVYVLFYIPTITKEKLDELHSEFIDEITNKAPDISYNTYLCPNIIKIVNKGLSNLLNVPINIEPRNAFDVTYAGVYLTIYSGFRKNSVRLITFLKDDKFEFNEWSLFYSLRKCREFNLTIGYILNSDALAIYKDYSKNEDEIRDDETQFMDFMRLCIEDIANFVNSLKNKDYTLGVCTNTNKFLRQYWFECIDCNLCTQIGVCVYCAYDCHVKKGHKVVFHHPVELICDCVARNTCCYKETIEKYTFTDLLDKSVGFIVQPLNYSFNLHPILLFRSLLFKNKFEHKLRNFNQELPSIIGDFDFNQAIIYLYGGNNETKYLEILQIQLPLKDWIKQFVNNKYLSDIILISDKTKFYAHRAILCNKSEYFNSIFTIGMNDIKKSKLVLDDGTHPKHVVLLLLNYLYINEINTEDINDMLSLLILAKKLSLGDLCNKCEIFITSLLSLPDEATNLLDICGLYDFNIIYRKCMDLLEPILTSDSDEKYKQIVYNSMIQKNIPNLLSCKFEIVILSADKAIKLRPEGDCAYAQKAMAYMCLTQYSAAEYNIKAALQAKIISNKDTYLYASTYYYIVEDNKLKAKYYLALMENDNVDYNDESSINSLLLKSNCNFIKQMYKLYNSDNSLLNNWNCPLTTLCYGFSLLRLNRKQEAKNAFNYCLKLAGSNKYPLAEDKYEEILS
jgi:hypothetical protein